MLAEWAVCRRVACLLGDADWDPALDSVRDRERLFFFFSWGLLQGKWFQTKIQRALEDGSECFPRDSWWVRLSAVLTSFRSYARFI